MYFLSFNALENTGNILPVVSCLIKQTHILYLTASFSFSFVSN